MTTTKPKSAADLRRELQAAQADLTATEARAAELQNAGEVDAKTVDELAKLTAKTALLRGGIRRLESELPRQERIEAQAEIERLQSVVSQEGAAAAKAAEKLAAEAVKLLVPVPDSHPAWSFAYCERRAHELGIFAQEHPAARVHTDKARNAQNEIRRLQALLAR